MKRTYTTMLSTTLPVDGGARSLRKTVNYYQHLVDTIKNHPLWTRFCKEYSLPRSPDSVSHITAVTLESIDPLTAAQFVRDRTGHSDILPGGFAHQLHPDLHLDVRMVELLRRKKLLHVNEKGLRGCRGVFRVTKWLFDHGENFILDNQTILPRGREIDVVLPDRRVGIEISPSVTHHSNAHCWDKFAPKPKRRTYHVDKHDDAIRAGWSLIQLFSPHLAPGSLDMRLGTLIDAADATRPVVDVECTTLLARGDTRELFDNAMRNTGSRDGAAAKYKLLARDRFGNVVGAAGVGAATTVDSSGGRVAEVHGLTVGRDYRRSMLSQLRDFARGKGFDSVVYFADSALEPVVDLSDSGFTHVTTVGPRLFFVSPTDWSDTYPGSVADADSAVSGVVERDRSMRKLNVAGDAPTDTPFDVQQYVECELTNRDGVNKGYDATYDAGGQLWVVDFGA